MSAKDKSDIIYALADYKQLVVAYKTKYAQMAGQVAFWKTSVIWLVFLCVGLAVTAAVVYIQSVESASSRQKDRILFEERERGLVRSLEQSRADLRESRMLVEEKEEIIKLLEKNVSTASKKLLEKILPEKERDIRE